ncbi:MAG: DNA primase [Elusimicrobiota bacterium]
MAFDRDVLARIIDQNNIVDIISDYVTLKKTGTNYKGLCPFHSEKTPSFIVSAEKQIYHCFGCHEGGDVLSFLMKVEHQTFPEAVKILAERAGIKIEETNVGKSVEGGGIKDKLFELNMRTAEFFNRYIKDSKNAGHAQKYLNKRGISAKIRDEFLLGYAPKGPNFLINLAAKQRIQMSLLEQAGLVRKSDNREARYKDWFWDRIIFPICDARGRVIAFGGRVLDDGEPKYLNSPETILFNKSATLYGLNKALPYIRKAERIIVLEGYMDVIKLYDADIKNVVATLGTALTEQHISLLRRYTREVIVVFDGDAAGIAASLRTIALFVNSGLHCRVVTLPEGLDPDDYVKKYGADAFKNITNSANDAYKFLVEEVSRKENVKSLAGKQRICEKVLPLVCKIDSALERNHLLRILSDTIHESENDLLAESKKYAKRVSGFKNVKADNNEKPVNKNIWPYAEIDLLRFLLHHPDALDLAEKNINLEWISNDSIIKTIKWLFLNVKEFKTLNTGVIISLAMNEWQMPDVNEIFSYVSVEETKDNVDTKRIFSDIAGVLKKNYLQKQLKDIEIKMKDNSDFRANKDIINEYEKIVKELKRGA